MGISISEQRKIYFNHRNTLISLLSNTLIELKAIITAVDKLSGPLKGMRREMKSFKKEFSAGMAGAAALGAGVVTAMAGPIKQAIDFKPVAQ
ncbi:hypothetical protein CBG25_10785 [Arsenophonus sp. ENCA]|uniref:hypothetical protein n=1 Tax=Arsenophonus sp. ENCA TaxID=1987579 RepID=UPI000BC472D8|nr:hypothetical protein [Arsenophonus sp. ENCA]PAV02451.1 hypothetical protein CBG25_10785 [Arsenophonus sp. ENCA]